jgi:c(7)-type cytochrome triheme protein
MRYLAVLAAVSEIVLCIVMAACRPPRESTQQPSPASPAPAPQLASNAAPPDTILFASKYGDVTYNHKKHYERLGGDCSMCHTKVFPQSREPLNYKKALHRAAEASRTSCAYCHAVGGTSFAADSNCIRCHAQKEY